MPAATYNAGVAYQTNQPYEGKVVDDTPAARAYESGATYQSGVGYEGGVLTAPSGNATYEGMGTYEGAGAYHKTTSPVRIDLAANVAASSSLVALAHLDGALAGDLVGAASLAAPLRVDRSLEVEIEPAAAWDATELGIVHYQDIDANLVGNAWGPYIGSPIIGDMERIGMRNLGASLTGSATLALDTINRNVNFGGVRIRGYGHAYWEVDVGVRTAQGVVEVVQVEEI